MSESSPFNCGFDRENQYQCAIVMGQNDFFEQAYADQYPILEMISMIKTNRQDKILIIIALILIGLNLRPSMAAIGPLLPFIQQDLHLSYTQISLLTMLPILVMGGAMFVSSRLIHRYHPTKLVMYSLVVIGASNLFRLFINGSELRLITSAITAGCGIAIIQAILPTIIKKNWPNAVSLYMGIYVTAIMGGAAIASSLVGAIEIYFHNWEVALSVWSILAVLALASWMIISSKIPDSHTNRAPVKQSLKQPIHKMARTWMLGLLFGLGTASYTCILAWLPLYYFEFGWSSTQAGLLLAGLTGVEVIAGLLFPSWASYYSDKRFILFIAVACTILGYLGLIFTPTMLPILWIVLLGLGIGGLFPMSLIVTMDHYEDPQQAGALTAFVQGLGYVLAAFSPLLAGIIKDTFNSFQLSWSILLGLTCLLLILIPQLDPNTYAAKMKA